MPRPKRPRQSLLPQEQIKWDHFLRRHVRRRKSAIDRQGDMRFCRAEKPLYRVKALENTQSILCGLFLVCEHFRSGRTATHRTALDFRGIFALLDAGGLTPAKEKRAKSTEKTGCPTYGSLPIDGRFSPTHMSPEKMIPFYLLLREQTL